MEAEECVYFQHILDASRKVASYIHGVPYASFAANTMMVDAVIRELEIIGEAATKISDHTRVTYPDFPWNEMVSMRNFLIHEYFGVDEMIVWKTAQEDVPALQQSLEKILD